VQAAFQHKGLGGLLPRKRGPKDRHKLSEEVMRFVNDMRQHEKSIGTDALAQRVKQHFGIEVHPRSIQRALAAQKKKRQNSQDDSD
jgi:transposase